MSKVDYGEKKRAEGEGEGEAEDETDNRDDAHPQALFQSLQMRIVQVYQQNVTLNCRHAILTKKIVNLPFFISLLQKNRA